MAFGLFFRVMALAPELSVGSVHDPAGPLCICTFCAPCAWSWANLCFLLCSATRHFLKYVTCRLTPTSQSIAFSSHEIMRCQSSHPGERFLFLTHSAAQSFSKAADSPPHCLAAALSSLMASRMPLRSRQEK